MLLRRTMTSAVQHAQMHQVHALWVEPGRLLPHRSTCTGS